jgi:SAM-dependent methyltransferase
MMIQCPLCKTDTDELSQSKKLDCHYRCPRCDLSFSWPLVSRDDAIEMFKDYGWTSSYSETTAETLAVAKRALSRKLEIIGRRHREPPVKTMLDVGCGNGLYMMAAKTAGIDAVGTEIDRINVDRGTTRGLDIRHGFLEDLDFGTQQFDFVHLRNVLHLSLTPWDMLRKAGDCLSPDGILYVDVSNQDGLASRLRILRNPSTSRYGQLEPPTHSLAYSRHSLRYLLDMVQLKALSVFSYSYGNWAYYPKLGAVPLRGVRYPSLAGPALRVADIFGMGGFLAAYCEKERASE